MQEHRLAAIMFTDIVGYTALMGKDEDRAFEVLRINREIHKTLLERYNGTLIKEMGDGILTSFTSASNAVRCALDIQEEAKGENISLRIGIHEGEVVYEGADVLGDGVNMASRLQELAEAGTVIISESVFNSVKNKDGIFPIYVGEKTLKNVEEPVKVYKVSGKEDIAKITSGTVKMPEGKKSRKLLYYIIGGIFIIALVLVLIWRYWAGPPSVPWAGSTMGMEKSIAILPFRNETEEKGTEYFANGVMEAILNDLCKISQLRVLSRTSSEKYRDTKLSSTEIAKELDVNYLLEGSVQKYGTKVRITAQLIEAGKDKHILSETYDRDYTDLLNLQSEIAQEIAGRLNVVLSPKEKELINKPATSNMQAYELYLRGKEYTSLYDNALYTGEEKYLNEAIRLYRDAIRVDPEFALAYFGIGDLFLTKHRWDLLDPKENYADSLNSIIVKILKLDNNLAEAYLLKGGFSFWSGKYSEAIDNADKALQLNPNSSMTYYLLGYAYAFLSNDKVKEIINFRKAERLEKSGIYSPQIVTAIGNSYLFLGDPVKADYYFRKALLIRPENTYALFLVSYKLFFLDKKYQSALAMEDTILSLTYDTAGYYSRIGMYYTYLKKFEKAFYCLEKEKEYTNRVGREFRDDLQYSCVLLNLGRKQEAKKLLDTVIRSLKNKPDQVTDYYLSGAYSLMGEKEKAIGYLQKFIKSGFLSFNNTYLDIYVNPMFDNIRQTEEFKVLLKEGEAQIKKKREEVRKLEEQGLL